MCGNMASNRVRVARMGVARMGVAATCCVEIVSERWKWHHPVTETLQNKQWKGGTDPLR